MIKWEIDTKHSEIHFKVKHMLISTVTGLFAKFNGKITTSNSDSFMDAQVQLSIDTQSVYTNEEYRDNHIKSADFFDAKHFPEITFHSNYLKPGSNNQQLILGGELTIKEITKEIELSVLAGGTVEDKGIVKAGFEVVGQINRKDFGLIYNPLMEAGGMVVSEQVELLANIALIKL